MRLASEADLQAPRLQVCHTSDLDAGSLETIRALLDVVFVDDPLDEHDWEHALGGMHVLVWEGDELVGHASVVQRRLTWLGRTLRAGYVEAVGVHPDGRRRGYGGILMDAIGRIVRGAYDLGALGASDEARPLYAGRGWVPWRGATWTLSPAGPVRTPDADDCLYVLPVTVELDVTGELTCDWRGGAVW